MEFEALCNKCRKSLLNEKNQNRQGIVNKNLCWICDMQENPDIYRRNKKYKLKVEEYD